MADVHSIGYVYVITNTVNGKQYVGQTTQTVGTRWTQHCSDASRPDTRKGCRALHAAIRKHGVESFAIHAMSWPVTGLDEIEDRLIRAFDSMAPRGYNLRTGGSCGKHSDVARAHMSEGQRRRAPASAETRAKQSAKSKGRQSWSKGKTFAEIGRVVGDETREKLRAANLGKPSPLRGSTMPPEWRAAISKALKGRVSGMKGRHQSDEAKAKMSASGKRSWAESNRPRTVSLEARAKISAAMKGRPKSPETCAKLSAAIRHAHERGVFKARRQK